MQCRGREKNRRIFKGDCKIAKLEIHDIRKTFGKGSSTLTALEGLDLTIEDQELCCVIGPSGCGKTTLLRIIGGFYTATSGSVKLDGVEIREPGADRGVVFQEYALFPWMTVLGNAEFGLRMKGIRKADRRPRVEEYLQMVGLSEFSDAATYNLSGGMQQRVAIVRALVNDPEVLLMDEPFGALDALTREEMEIELLKVWKKTKKTILFITHDVEEAVFLSTRLVILTARPGTVKENLELPFANDFPITGGLNEARSLKTDPAFIDVRTRALKSIWDERTS